MRTRFKLCLLAMLSIVFITSCEKDDVVNVQEEGLMSSTGDGIIASDLEGIPVISKVVYQKHYDSDLSMEEADAMWLEDVGDMNISELKDYSTEWFFYVRILTGTQTNNETDGAVYIYVTYTTDIGTYTSTSQLDDPEDDYEGGWDYFTFNAAISGEAVQWIQLNSATIGLKGTDGWFIKSLYVSGWPYYQNVSASGSTNIYSYPNVWLDNSSSSGWDYYSTGTIGTGTLYF